MGDGAKLQELVEIERATLEQIETGQREWDRAHGELEQVLANARKMKTAIIAGLASSDYEVGSSIMSVSWPREARNRPLGDTIGEDVFTRARRLLEEGGTYFRTGYVGQKQYDRWVSQRSDHPYGYGPGHGHVWVSIGFKPEHRGAEKGALTPDEILSCLRYLQYVQDSPEKALY